MAHFERFSKRCPAALVLLAFFLLVYVYTHQDPKKDDLGAIFSPWM
jgi:hypothetical protein